MFSSENTQINFVLSWTVDIRIVVFGMQEMFTSVLWGLELLVIAGKKQFLHYYVGT